MSGIVTLSEAPATSLGRLLMENRFFVPTHQRDYRWDQDRVRKLFDDLVEAMDRGDRFYFVGLMVFMQSTDGRLRVLDGQQRLATTVIIFSAIRAWFAVADGSSSTASNIQSDFIGRPEYGVTETVPKLTLNLNNDERFQRYVVNGSPLAEIRKERASASKYAPNFALLDAIIYVHSRIEKIATELGTVDLTKQRLTKLIVFLKDSVVAVRLTVPNEANAFRVFETLNDRGLDLSAADLLKNYLFGLTYDVSPMMLQQIEHRWSQITQELTEVNEADVLRVFWTSRYGRTQLDDVFEDARTRIRTGDAAINLSIDLLEAAEHYVALDSPDDSVWNPHTSNTRERLRSLNLLGSKQVRPVLLSAIKRFSPHEMERLLELLEAVIVRYQLIGGRRTGLLETQSARLAERIWKEEVKTATDAKSLLSLVYPSDDDFHAAFASKEGLTNQKSAYILRSIEMYERKNVYGADAKNLDPGKALSVEHILPKGGGYGWNVEVEADPELIGDCSLRIGNLCLLTEPRNRELDRKGFSEKRVVYSASDLLITRRIAGFESWNRLSVNQYQHWLASRAVTVWRFA